MREQHQIKISTEPWRYDRKDGPIRTCRSPGKRTLKTGSPRQILQVVKSSRAFTRTFNESTNPKDWIIGTSNESSNPQDQIVGASNRSANPQDRIIGTSKESMNPQDWITHTLKESKSCIRTQKPLISHKKPYPYAKAAYSPQKPYTYANDQT